MNAVFAAIFSLAAAGLPDGWIFQPHREYQPAPECRCDVVDGEQVLRVEDIKGPNGSLFGPDLKIPAVSGRSVLVKAAVRGEGVFSVSLAGPIVQIILVFFISAPKRKIVKSLFSFSKPKTFK